MIAHFPNLYYLCAMVDFNNLFEGMRIGLVAGILLNIFVLWGCWCGWRNSRRAKEKEKEAEKEKEKEKNEWK